jgi:predicted SAM-dependent methyltransferase
MKLHLGSGRNVKNDYINIDKYVDFPGVEKFDIFNLPYADNAAEEILSEHLVEHIGFEHEEAYWRECARVLKPGGTLITETPDMEWLCSQFLNANDFFRDFYKVGSKDHYFGNNLALDQRWGIIATYFFGNQNGKGQFHHNGYTEQKLIRVAQLIDLKYCTVEKKYNNGIQVLIATMIK